MNEYKDDDIGCVNDEKLEGFDDEINPDDFDDILQEFINENATRCRKVLDKYKKETETHVKIGEDPKDLLNESMEIRKVAFKILKQKNGEIVRLVTKEYMDNYRKEADKEITEKTREMVKQKILAFSEEWLRKCESGEADQEVPDREVEGEGDQENWDVESILSTRTNTDNHPGIVKSVVRVKKNAIKLNPKTRAPELEGEVVQKEDKKKSAYVEEEVSDDSDEDIDVETKEIADLEKMTEKERKKYMRKLNKKQVKKEKKERRIMKKQMKKVFSSQSQEYQATRTVGMGELRPGTSVKHL